MTDMKSNSQEDNAKPKLGKSIFNKILIFVGIVVALVVISISGEIGREIADNMFSSKPSQQEIETKITESFTKVAHQLKSQLPIMVDEHTQLYDVTVENGGRCVYHYIFPQYSSRDITAKMLHTDLKPKVVQQVCSNKDMKLSLQYGGIYIYAYSGNNNIEITRFKVDRKDCGFASIFN